ncbi:MAG: hypothetical protein U1F43_26375 [Myxococcota bacterium]
MSSRRARVLLVASALGSSAAIAGFAAAGSSHGVRTVAMEGVPTGFFPALTTDALGRPIYSVTVGDIFDSATLMPVTMIRHLDGTWHLLELPGRSPKPLRFVPTLGLVDGADIVEPGRYAPIPDEDIGPTTDLTGNPIDLELPDAEHPWLMPDGAQVTTAGTDFVDVATGAVLAHFPTTARSPDGPTVTLRDVSGPVVDARGRFYVTGRDGQDPRVDHGYLLVHFPGDGVDAWTQAAGTFSIAALPRDDGSGRVWLANTGPLREIVFD